MRNRSANKYLSLLLAVWLLASSAVPAAWAAPEDTVSISSAEDLLALSKNCALDTWSQGKTVALTADLDLTGTEFSPIPTFGGTFLGQGHTISGLRLTAAGSNQGFFRYLQPGAVVQNLHISGAVIPEGTRSTVGGIAGTNAGTIQNCSFQGTVQGKNAVGGIAGRNGEQGQIINCTTRGHISGENAAGGTAGRNLGILLKCENFAGVNMTEPSETGSFMELEAEAISEPLSGENDGEYSLLSSYADTGGIVGYSSGVVQSCVNSGTVGYPHVGYNTGGIAGRQSGYLAGCINSGTVRGRKEVGGIVGQAEPYLAVDPERDGLDRLRTELDTLDRLINQALNDAQRTGDDVSAHLTAMGNYADKARDSSQQLLDHTGDFIDENLNTVNTLVSDITNALDRIIPALDDLADVGARLERLSNHLGGALDDLGDAAGLGEVSMAELRTAVRALKEAGGKLSDSAAALQEALEALLKGVISGDEAARAAALEQAKAAFTELDGIFAATAAAAGGLRAALSEAGNLPGSGETLPALENLKTALNKTAVGLGQTGDSLPASPEDWETAQAALRRALQALRDASGGLDDALSALQRALETVSPASGKLRDALEQLQDVSASSASIGRLLHSAFRTISDAVDSLTGDGPVEFSPLGEDIRTAGDGLYDAMAGLSGEMKSLNGVLQDGNHTLTEDLRSVSRQFNAVFDSMLDILTDLRNTPDKEDLIQDTSDQDISATREGKVADCHNTGPVEGDRNVGGVAGAMAIEFDLDPEDDVTDRLSFGTTYETKAVLQNCLNRGAVTAKKDCVGGIVGRMDLGTALDCQNYGAAASTDGDYVGGVAGLADASVRSCYAKNTLSGGNYIGGVAGWASYLRDCFAIAAITDGSECLGAIAGGVENGGVFSGNRFVDTGTAGIDGVSYAGHAEPIDFAELRQLPDIPPEFTTFTLTLLAGGETVSQIPFFYGDDLSALQLPEVPAQEGSYGSWPEFDVSGRVSDITLEAVYAPWVTLVASAKTEGKLPLALAEGRFTHEAVLHVTEGPQTPPPEGGTVWTLSLAGTDLGSGDAVPLRLLAPSGAQVWQYRDGQWIHSEAVQNGQYLMLSMEGTEGTFCIQSRADGPWLFLILAAAVLLLIILLAVTRRRKKQAVKSGAPAKSHAEKEPAAK